jgi:hypothetical protein
MTMSGSLDRILGPRVPFEEASEQRSRYLIPTVLFVVAAVLLIVSFSCPTGG